ncbi:hypothetical protein N0V93_008993 [Gnomoniopsis smithogilvyi]|uniref:F-box domain-containing protein n=1 Tax=Gnomoniopsis smithogilvyi TaxID=1191159 RepID=A0A9W8YK95_9PEZI|nr:hypothetical protein N0V93_008993 [Gnomoniopsis smithogilvyi]
MPPRKHHLSDDTSASSPRSRPIKRPRLSGSPSPDLSHAILPHARRDLLSPLSDEILLRILSYLTLPQLLAVAPVSRRYHRLAEDSQLWKALYYARFVLPRAMRIPGFRGKASVREHKLHYKGRRTIWADGRLGGLVREHKSEGAGYMATRLRIAPGEEKAQEEDTRVNWKRQFKIRHNWAKGKCAVEELKLGPDPEAREGPQEDDDEEERSKMLVKVAEGLAVTADATFGLRAWDLKTREVVAQTPLHAQPNEDESAPSCIAIDDCGLEKGILDIAIGFTDGSFGVWRLREDKTLVRRYRHEKSSNGELVGMSYSHPYLLTATGAVLVSLYTFHVPEKPEADNEDESDNEHLPLPSWLATDSVTEEVPHKSTHSDEISLPAPYLVTSLKSHTSDPPLALSIRKTGNITVASIAYTFFTRQGWSIGIQDLHITPNARPQHPPHINTRLAYTNPVQAGPSRAGESSPASRPQYTPSALASARDTPTSSPAPLTPPLPPPVQTQTGPTTLSYTHPYLLATLPDNTLILHLCTSTAAALSVSPGIRLWGHTSGISDADITARGKAVSVSSRGEEMRVWELEGRPSGLKSRSVEIRAGGGSCRGAEGAWDERRNWVGFDDEMVIVLKEAKGGRESLMVYDFT